MNGWDLKITQIERENHLPSTYPHVYPNIFQTAVNFSMVYLCWTSIVTWSWYLINLDWPKLSRFAKWRLQALKKTRTRKALENRNSELRISRFLTFKSTGFDAKLRNSAFTVVMHFLDLFHINWCRNVFHQPYELTWMCFCSPPTHPRRKMFLDYIVIVLLVSTTSSGRLFVSWLTLPSEKSWV